MIACAATDECEWYGVTCDDNGSVQMLSFRKSHLLILRFPSSQHDKAHGACETVSDQDGNNLKGALPREISLLTQLRRFVAPTNGLVGNIEDPFHGLTLLDTLVLSSNKLSGTMPAKLLELNPNLGKLVINTWL